MALTLSPLCHSDTAENTADGPLVHSGLRYRDHIMCKILNEKADHSMLAAEPVEVGGAGPKILWLETAAHQWPATGAAN